MMEDKGLDAYRGELNRRCLTIGEALRPAGYGTYAVGKWHVTKAIQPDGPKHNVRAVGQHEVPSATSPKQRVEPRSAGRRASMRPKPRRSNVIAGTLCR